MRKGMDNVIAAWQKRARLFGSTPRAVMEQSFPDVVNLHLEQIHLTEIMSAITQNATRILDIGCGWGRLTKEVVKSHKGFIYGIDPSPEFVKTFNKRLKGRGKAVVGDMRRLPYKDNFFDAIYCVVSFMYMETIADQKKAIAEMLRVLKPGGTIVLIEPGRLGVSFFHLWGIVPYIYRTLLHKPKVETFGTAFSLRQIEGLVEAANGRIYDVHGYPLLTFILLPSVLLGKVFPLLTKFFLYIVGKCDQYVRFAKSSYIITWIIKKP